MVGGRAVEGGRWRVMFGWRFMVACGSWCVAAAVGECWLVLVNGWRVLVAGGWWLRLGGRWLMVTAGWKPGCVWREVGWMAGCWYVVVGRWWGVAGG